MKIDVTEDDIKRGYRHDSHECAIALAAVRAGLGIVYVEREFLSWGQKSTKRSPLPPEAQAFIARFDNWEPVVPFSFEVEATPWTT